MKGKFSLALMASFVLAAAVSAQTAKAPVFIPAADLKWASLDPTGAPGVMSADVWGDHTKGAFGGFTKFPAGFQAPLHTHTNELKIVVISGTFLQTPEGTPVVRLGPGSYLVQPAEPSFPRHPEERSDEGSRTRLATDAAAPGLPVAGSIPPAFRPALPTAGGLPSVVGSLSLGMTA